LAVAFPDMPIYVSDVEKDFIRPSLYVEFVAEERTGIGRKAYRTECSYQVKYFQTLNGNFNVDRIAQLSAYDSLMAVLDQPAYAVEGTDKYATVESISGNKDETEITISIKLSLTADRVTTPEEYDLINSIESRRMLKNGNA